MLKDFGITIGTDLAKGLKAPLLSTTKQPREN
jgi:hypothetical protein